MSKLVIQSGTGVLNSAETVEKTIQTSKTVQKLLKRENHGDGITTTYGKPVETAQNELKTVEIARITLVR